MISCANPPSFYPNSIKQNMYSIFPPGQKVDRIKVSDVAKKTTSVCFGGPNMDEMYMTCARNDLKDGQDDCSGSIFKVRSFFDFALKNSLYN